MSSICSTLAAAFGFGGAASGEAIDAAELKRRLAAGEVPVLVDVRSAAEFAGGHVPEALHIPLGEIDQSDALDGYRDQTVYLICRSGARSARAQSALIAAGFEAVNVRGGTSAWVAAGYPVSAAR